MKVALLLTGNLRNYKDTYSGMKHYLLDELKPDVFFYGEENKEGVEQNIKDFTEMYKPVSFKINPRSYYENIQYKHHIKNTHYSFYNVKKCNDLRLEYQKQHNIKYDVVIRCRLDNFWFRKISDFELEKSKTELVIPKEWCFKEVHPLALSDIFAIGNDEMMTVYSQLIDCMYDYYKDRYNAETLIGLHVHKNNLKYYLTDRHFEFYYPCKSLEEKTVPKPHKFVQYFDVGIDDVHYRTSLRKSF